jgi:hypothetical protein
MAVSSEVICVFIPQLMMVVSGILKITWEKLGSYGFVMVGVDGLFTAIAYRYIINTRLKTNVSTVAILISGSNYKF